MALLGFNGIRPAITGIGVVAPNGIGVAEFWTSLVHAQSAMTWLPLNNSHKTSKCIGARVNDSQILSWCEETSQRLDRPAHLGFVAARMALQNAEFTSDLIAKLDALPVFTAGITTATKTSSSGDTHTPAHQYPLTLYDVLNEYLRATTVPINAFGSNTSGLEVAAVAARAVCDGFSPIALVIASHASLTADLWETAERYQPFAETLTDPSRASRPFDRDRFGSLPSEAAAAIVIEDVRHARARGVQGCVEIAGFASTMNHAHAEPLSELSTAIATALANAQEMPHAIGYISAFAPSDPVADRVETRAIKAALGATAYRIPVSSIKGVTGNPKACAGMLQLVATALAARNGIIPPTANYEHADPLCDLDYVPAPRRVEFQAALVHAHTPAGHNQAMVVRNLT